MAAIGGLITVAEMITALGRGASITTGGVRWVEVFLLALTASRLPDANAWPVVWRADELDAGCFEGDLNCGEITSRCGGDAVVRFYPLNRAHADAGVICQFLNCPSEAVPCRSNLGADKH